MNISDLVKRLTEANDAYRIGFPIISDSEYDILIDHLTSLDPDNEFLNKIGMEVSESRKRKLDIEMASMDKEKTIEEIFKWARLKNIPLETELIGTPKYDGASLCVEETTNKASTRGDGTHGQIVDEHYTYMSNKLHSPICKYTYGEVMMRKSVFEERYSSEFKNPRNLVSGRLNADDPSEILSDMEYIKYGAVGMEGVNTKEDILNKLNDNQDYKVPFFKIQLKDITEEYLISMFFEWSTGDYEFDGVILEVNDLSYQEKLGRERSGNPAWARAFKSPLFEQSANTKVLEVVYDISKNGLLKPVVYIDPVELNSVTISKVTGYNARYVKDMGIGIGAVIEIKRSGMVIPKIINVIEPVEFTMPDIEDIEWNENGVELRTLYETDAQKIKKIAAFFLILGVKDVSDKTFERLWHSGYQSVRSILNMTIQDYLAIDGFQERKAKLTFDAIHSKMKNVELPKLQHASGCFSGLGSKKLALLEQFYNKKDLTIDNILCVEGFQKKSAEMYLNGIANFKVFIDGLNLSIVESKEIVVGSDELSNEVFVFTGIRDKKLEDIIVYRGGKIGSGVSKKTTKLIMKSIGSGSSKEKKALELGIEIMTIQDLENFLGL